MEFTGPSFTWVRILSTCVKSMWMNDIKCKYMFMFPLKNLARKGLIPTLGIFYFTKVPVRLFQSHSYLIGVTTASLQRHLPNMNVAYDGILVFWWFWKKNCEIDGTEEIGFLNPASRFNCYFVSTRQQSNSIRFRRSLTDVLICTSHY